MNFFREFGLGLLLLNILLGLAPQKLFGQENSEDAQSPLVGSGGGFLGGLLPGPASNNQPSPKSKPSLHWRSPEEAKRDEDLESSLLGATVGAIGGAVVYQTAAMTISGSRGFFTTYTTAKFDDQEMPPAWEVQYNEQWIFESRRNRPLASGSSTAFFRDLEWQGANGFQLRLTHQPYVRLGTEIILDHVADQEVNRYAGMSSFATLPSTVFPDTTLLAGRSMELISTQMNLLIRSNPSVFYFGGIRWWHVRDKLTLTTIGPSVQSRTLVDAPIIQVGVQYGNLGRRVAWRNRFGFGLGPVMLDSRIDTSSILGATSPIGDYAIRLAMLMELRTELEFSLTKNIAIRTGAQFIGLNSALRASSQLDVTNLSTGRTRVHNDSIMYSAIFAGVNVSF